MRIPDTGTRARGAWAAAVVPLCLLAGCAGGTAAATGSGMPPAADTVLEGVFRWTTLNGQTAPVEFPPGSGATLVVTGQDGRFRVVADSLLFTPDGREDRPPVRFRYAWRGAALALTDAQGHVWTYVRQ